ncbi:MAG: hypothetical protein IJO94_01165 [Firmicutes bacterium]|nr:hypothetical protein [Bacillota bacterium]MBQ6809994.1 hypothetical protein [Bacillota bacterium]
MSLSSFFRRLFGRSEKTKSREEMLWVELKVPEDTEPVDKKILNALSGKSDPLSAEAAVTEFLDYGWERIKNEVYAFFTGKKPCLHPYLKRILHVYPEETARLLDYCFEDMPYEQRLIFLSVGCAEQPDRAVAEVKKILPELEVEEIGTAFAVLVACPSAEGEALLCSYLEKEDWRLKMKAASALKDGKFNNSIEAIRKAASSCDDTVRAGLEMIADQMEGK